MTNLARRNSLLLKHARTATYALAVLLLAVTIFFAGNARGINYIKLADNTGFLAFTFLCLALAVTPIRKLSPSFALNPPLYRARRALGVSAFGFALVHSALRSGVQYGVSFERFLFVASGNGVIYGVIAFAILLLLASISTDWAVRKMGKAWFDVQKLAYLAYPLIVSHAVIAGIDFSSINAYSASFVLVAAATLVLEAARVWKERIT
ncbi:hypothetical protein AUJ14_05110 [Candidatus Micrarchaeota archaeon CG1_02_55_22]|nr:MAG: hypothetical protein AUJ14_05110 [Candidatus Micrarchaeota archaeon CG1_02_55_22]